MGKLTGEVFNEACCDGGECNTTESAQPCGCDPGHRVGGKVVGWVCEYHRTYLEYGKDRWKEPASCSRIEGIGIKEGDLASRDAETIITDAQTGGQKGSKLARFSLIPFDFLWALAEHYGRGAQKYADRNWERGYKWSLTVDAQQRHLAQWLQGEDNDPETGSSHLIAAAWHIVALWWFHRHGKGTDDVRAKNTVFDVYDSRDVEYPIQSRIEHTSECS